MKTSHSDLTENTDQSGAWGHLESFPLTLPALRWGHHHPCPTGGEKMQPRHHQPASLILQPRTDSGYSLAHTAVGMDLGPSSRLLHGCIFLETRISSDFSEDELFCGGASPACLLTCITPSCLLSHRALGKTTDVPGDSSPPSPREAQAAHFH